MKYSIEGLELITAHIPRARQSSFDWELVLGCALFVTFLILAVFITVNPYTF